MSIVEKFETFLKAEGKSPRTIEEYKKIASRFLSFVGNRDFTVEDGIRFLASLSRTSDHYQMMCSYAIRSLFKCMGKDFLGIPVTKVGWDVLDIKTISEDKIREVCMIEENIKYKAMFALAYELGLRVSEVAMLRYGWLDTKTWTCRVSRVKHSRSRVEPIVSGWVKEILVQYLSSYHPKDDEAPLFPSQKQDFYTHIAVSQIFSRMLRNTGIDVKPHVLRHSRATNLLKDGIDVYTVAELLGHKTLSSTMAYLHITADDLRKRLERKS